MLKMTGFFSAPKPVGRRSRKPGVDRKPRFLSLIGYFMIHDLIVDIIVDNLVFRQAYSAKQLDKLEAEFKVNSIEFNPI